MPAPASIAPYPAVCDTEVRAWEIPGSSGVAA